jgi:hypothetical protein
MIIGSAAVAIWGRDYVRERDLDRHQDECSKRYGEITRQMERIADKLDKQDELVDKRFNEFGESQRNSRRGIYTLLWSIAIGLIALLLTALGTLVFYLLTGHRV